METAYYYLALCGLLTVLQWTPYILNRAFVWGIPTFLGNYPEGYPSTEPAVPLWAARSKRAHLNMVETLPAFIAVFLAVLALKSSDSGTMHLLTLWTQVFLFSRLAYAVIYTAGIPAMRTPSYLVSWFAILATGYLAIA